MEFQLRVRMSRCSARCVQALSRAPAAIDGTDRRRYRRLKQIFRHRRRPGQACVFLPRGNRWSTFRDRHRVDTGSANLIVSGNLRRCPAIRIRLPRTPSDDSQIVDAARLIARRSRSLLRKYCTDFLPLPQHRQAPGGDRAGATRSSTQKLRCADASQTIFPGNSPVFHWRSRRFDATSKLLFADRSSVVRHRRPAAHGAISTRLDRKSSPRCSLRLAGARVNQLAEQLGAGSTTPSSPAGLIFAS